MKYVVSSGLLTITLLMAGINRVSARNMEVGIAVPCDIDLAQIRRDQIFVRASVRDMAAKCSNSIAQNGESMVVDAAVSDIYCYKAQRRSGLNACAFLTNKLLADSGLARVRDGKVIRIVPLDAVPAGTPPDDDTW